MATGCLQKPRTPSVATSAQRYNPPMLATRSGTCRRRILAALSAVGGIALLPSAVWGEGAVRLLDCTVVRVCDTAGMCETGAGAVSFRMEPVQVGPDGTGRYELEYGDTKVAMNSLSDIGPFVWTAGAERNTLLASSETNFLWHRLSLDAVPAATVRFLACTIRQ
jgi:hypothetical protein